MEIEGHSEYFCFLAEGSRFPIVATFEKIALQKSPTISGMVHVLHKGEIIGRAWPTNIDELFPPPPKPATPDFRTGDIVRLTEDWAGHGTKGKIARVVWKMDTTGDPPMQLQLRDGSSIWGHLSLLPLELLWREPEIRQ
jgi:hypothetical protein